MSKKDKTESANVNYTTEMPLIMNQLLMSRMELARRMMDPRRDIAEECGHPRPNSVSEFDYQDLYDGDAIANRVVEVLPKETWQTIPEVYENEDTNCKTEFDKAYESLVGQFRGASKYSGEESNPLMEYLLRLDIAMGIGHYGVLLLGFDDGKPLEEPIDLNRNFGRVKLKTIRIFPHANAKINVFNSDMTSPRYGLPESYRIQFYDPMHSPSSGIGVDHKEVCVHWSRVIHAIDNPLSNEVFGAPRMRSVLPRILDARKLYGGSAEMYWKGAFPGLSLETHPQLGGDVVIDKAGISQSLDDYFNGLQRVLKTSGMSAKPLAPQVVDPTSQIEVQLTAICIQLGIPKRVFMGSERGELASSQDDQAWNDRLRHRQRLVVNPRIIIPTIDRLIDAGVLPEPEQYYIKWPSLDSQTPGEKANVAQVRTTAMSTYVSGGLDVLMSPNDFLVRELGYTQDEAEQIADSATEHIEAANPDTEDDVVHGVAPKQPMPEGFDPANGNNPMPPQQGGKGQFPKGQQQKPGGNPLPFQKKQVTNRSEVLDALREFLEDNE